MKVEADIDEDLDREIARATKALDCSKAEIVRTALKIALTTELAHLEGWNGDE